ncbi:MAG TPA: response regulator [Elusimicrobiota bacterium]|nr:response regulator [Elusimicrobiota bacterium]
MPAPSIKKVLIVDDERDLVGPLALRLKASGLYEVAVAYDGMDGLARAEQFRPDAALIDLAMPGLDGWHLCRRLREDPRTRRTKVIVMTAWLSPDLGRRALAEGVSQLLLKPFEEADLLKALEDESAAVKACGGGRAP